MLQTTRLANVLLAGIALAGTSAFAADPNLLNLVMPDAKVIGGVNVTNVTISPLGTFLLTKLAASGGNLQIPLVGINPIHDISEILVASPANTPNPTGLIMASGNFPVDKITALAGTRKNTQIETYGNATLLVNSGENGSNAVAFLGNTIAIAGDLATVKAAIDRQTSPASIDPALTVKINQLSGSEDEWLVSTAPVASLLPANATQQAQGQAAQILPLLKSIQSFNSGVKFTDTISFSSEAVTTDAKNAQALQAVIKLGIALASSMNTSTDPQAADFIKLLQSTQVTVDGSAVDIALSVPESQVEALVNSIPHTAVTNASTPARRLRERNGEQRK